VSNGDSLSADGNAAIPEQNPYLEMYSFCNKYQQTSSANNVVAPLCHGPVIPVCRLSGQKQECVFPRSVHVADRVSPLVQNPPGSRPWQQLQKTHFVANTHSLLSHV